MLGLVVAAAILAGFLGRNVSDHLTKRESDFTSWRSESFSVAHELESATSKKQAGLPNVAALVDGERAAFGVHAELESLPQVQAVIPKLFASRNKDLFAILGWLRKDLPEGPAAFEVARKLERPGVKVGGLASVRQEFTQQTEEDRRQAELIAFPLLLIAGLWVFRSLIAALLPVLVGALTLMSVLGCIQGLTEVLSLSLFSLNVAMALALGLVVDYALLIVSRFREELAAGRAPAEAAAVTVATAGRTVAISCAAISAAALALLVFPIVFVQSAAVTGMVVSLVAGAISLLVLPALLTLLGDRVNALAIPRRRSLGETSRPRSAGFWYRIARFVMRRPVPVALASAALLGSMALPMLGMRFIGFDATSLPPSSNARVFAEEAQENFEHPGLGEVALAIHGDLKTAKRASVRAERLARRTGLAVPSPYGFERSPRLWLLTMNPTHAAFSSESKDLVDRLRGMDAPIEVSGDTAAYVDTALAMEHHLPQAVAILVVVTLFFYGLATRSLVLPIKALLMNLLGLAATCGILVFVFQEGHLEGVLGYQSQHALVLALPVVVAAGAFGLLTDYGLFLLMRIKEARKEGLADREAIALGLERTGRIITAAAFLFCIAVGPFATSELLLVKEGVMGVAIAVLLDAFIVRPLLVPSLMAILGRWNWWPGSLSGRG